MDRTYLSPPPQQLQLEEWLEMHQTRVEEVLDVDPTYDGNLDISLTCNDEALACAVIIDPLALEMAWAADNCMDSTDELADNIALDALLDAAAMD